MASIKQNPCPSCSKPMMPGKPNCHHCGWKQPYSNSGAITATCLVLLLIAVVPFLNPRDKSAPASSSSTASSEPAGPTPREIERERVIAEAVRTGQYPTESSLIREALKREGAPSLNAWDGLFDPAHDWLTSNLHDPSSCKVSDTSIPVRIDASEGSYYKQAATVRAKNAFGAIVATRYLFTVHKDGRCYATPLN